MNDLASVPESKMLGLLKINQLSKSQLAELSSDLGLGLNTEEMVRLRNYFKSLGRNPTETELQAMGQAWSEHCCYKSSKIYLKKHLSGIKTDYTVLAMEDDAGVVSLGNGLDYAVKMESHNHPSAVEPYGGSATGVGGILRDVLCMGAQPIAIIDSLYLGNGKGKVPEGYLSTSFTVKNIVGGIRDYGNRVGIPTVAGSLYFGEQFDGIPLVNAGCIGIMDHKLLSRSRVSSSDDILVLAGGKTGRDGIHGVNFASRVLEKDDKESKRAVQLGNPIIKEPLIKAVLECNRKGLILGMKDLGGGGLSSAAGEMCLAGGAGGEINLDQIPLKEEKMEPWEIWISESQERMLIATDESRLKELESVMEHWGIICNVIGKSVKGKRMRLTFKGREVMNLSLDFLTSGPVYSKPYSKVVKRNRSFQYFSDNVKIEEEIIKVLTDPNCAGKFRVIRQYDHTVRGNTVVKPLTGNPNLETHSDSAVMRVDNHDKIGVSLSSSSHIDANSQDAYVGTFWTLCRVFRNLISTGSNPHSLIDALNFGNPDHMDIMAQVNDSLKAIGEFCRYFKIPPVAGNVSLYNNIGKKDIPPTPNILMVGVIDDYDRVRTTEFKESDSLLYLIGYSGYSLSGSVYSKIRDKYEDTLETINLEELESMRVLLTDRNINGYVLSTHDISSGGLITSLLEMSFGSQIGFNVDISSISHVRVLNKLFSEAGNRFIVEVKREHGPEFEEKFKGVYCKQIGNTGGEMATIMNDAQCIFQRNVNELREIWENALNNFI